MLISWEHVLRQKKIILLVSLIIKRRQTLIFLLLRLKRLLFYSLQQIMFTMLAWSQFVFRTLKMTSLYREHFGSILHNLTGLFKYHEEERIDKVSHQYSDRNVKYHTHFDRK